MVDFLQAAHDSDERYSARDGINIASYALKRLAGKDAGMTSEQKKEQAESYLKEAAAMILDDTAARYFKDMMEER